MSTRTPTLMCYGCAPIANNAQLQAYVNWACSTGKITDDCRLTSRFRFCDEDDSGFTDPVTDDACWFDPNYAESADFLGVFIEDMDGMDQDGYSRSTNTNLNDGFSLGRGTRPGRVLTFRVVLFGTSCSGIEWGRRWLERTLRGESCGHSGSGNARCGTSELRLRVCCPNDTATDPGIRIFPRAALTDGVKRTDGERRDACTSVYQRFTFVMSTTTAASFGEIEEECVDVLADPNDVSCVDWDTWCGDVTTAVDCSCPTTCDGSCPEELFTSPSLLADDIPCGPFERAIACCCIGGTASSTIGSAVVLELFAGEAIGFDAATDVLVEFYANPKQIPCPTNAEERDLIRSNNELCASVSACRIPSGSILRIDGRTGQVTLQCNDVTRPVYDLVSGDVSKIVAGCSDLIACVSWNAWSYVPGPASPGIKPSSFSVWTASRFE